MMEIYAAMVLQGIKNSLQQRNFKVKMEKNVKTTNDTTNLIIVLKSLRYGRMNKLYVTQMAKMPNILGIWILEFYKFSENT